MAETLRRPRGGAQPDVLPRSSLSQPSARWLRSGGAGLLVFVVLYAFLEARVANTMPGYPAALLVTLAMFVVPGLVVCEALLSRAEGDLIERIVMALAIGVALTAPAGLLALSLRLSLDSFIHWHVATTTCVAAIAGYCARSGAPSWPARTLRGWSAPALVLLVFAAVAVGGILTAPVWAAGRSSRNFDDWRYMMYVNSYLHEKEIDPLHPVGVGEAPYPRMAINVWVVDQAAIARAADVDAEHIVLDDLTPLLTVLALGATYCLAKGLFRSRGIALLAVLIQLGIALTDVSRDEGLGHGLLLRIAEDKFLATYVLLPLGLLFAAKFMGRPRVRGMLTFVLTGFAMFIVHPQPLMFLAITVCAFAVLRAAVSRTWQPVAWAALLAVPLALFAFGEFLCWHLFNTSWPFFFETKLTWRESFKIVHLPRGMIMGNYHLLLYPLMIGAITVAPIIWLRGRKGAAHQMLVAATAGWLPIFFMPPLTTVVAKLASAELTARLPQMAPVAVVCAYAVYAALHWARRHWPVHSKITGAPLGTVAVASLGTLVLVAALLIQELYFPIDKGAYFTWSSRHAIVPGTNESIFLGGKDRLLSGEWRVSPENREIFAYLDARVGPGSTVLMPEDMSLYFPGLAWNAKPAFSQGILGQWERPASQGLYNDKLRSSALSAALAEDGIDYVVVKEVSNAGNEMMTLSTASLVVGLGPYQIYAISQTEALMPLRAPRLLLCHLEPF